MTQFNHQLTVTSTDLVAAFDTLALALAEFCQQLKLQQPNCWVALSEGEEGLADLDKARSYYQDIWYKDQQDGRETRSCYGLVVANTGLLELAQAVNDAKDDFKQLVQRVQKNHKDWWLNEKSQLNKRHHNLRDQLYYPGLSRIHLKQLYRHIPILKQRPEKIGFTWYSN